MLWERRLVAVAALLVLAVFITVAGQSVTRPAAVAFAAEPSASWPQFRFDPSHSGGNPDEHTIASANAGTLSLYWRFEAGDFVWSSPAVADGVVFVGSGDGNLYVLDASTGATLWRYATGGPLDSSPAVADGVVYVGASKGTVYALNAATGAKLWGYKTADSRGVKSSPAVAGGVVYVGTMGSFFNRGPYRVLAFRPKPPLTISSTPSTVPYGSAFALTVHLGLTGVTNDLVRIYRTPFGGSRTFVTSKHLEPSGDVSVKVGGHPVTTAFTATWAGDAAHGSLTSNPVYVNVSARVTGTLSRYYGVSKGYRLHRYTTHAMGSPAFTATVVPNHAGGGLDFRLQRHTSAGWRTVAVGAGYRLTSKSHARVVWVATDASVKGRRMRTRAEWPGDPRNARSWSGWAYFRVMT